MDCAKLHERLDEWLADRLGTEDAKAIRLHLDSCEECRAVESTLREGTERDDAFVGGVMAQTTGRACSSATAKLGEFLDGTLATEDASLVSGHLDSCVACRGVADLLCELEPVLASMADRAPDANFTADVLLKTLPQPSLWSVFLRRSQDMIHAALMRSAFPQEAAFVATLLLVLLTATPFAPWPQLPARALQVVKDMQIEEPPASADANVVAVGPVVVLWDSFAQSEAVKGITDQSRDVGAAWGSGLRARGARSLDELGGLGNDLRAMGGHVLHGRWPELKPGMQQIRCDLKRLWEGLRTPDTEAEGLCDDADAAGTKLG